MCGIARVLLPTGVVSESAPSGSANPELHAWDGLVAWWTSGSRSAVGAHAERALGRPGLRRTSHGNEVKARIIPRMPTVGGNRWPRPDSIARLSEPRASISASRRVKPEGGERPVAEPDDVSAAWTPRNRRPTAGKSVVTRRNAARPRISRPRSRDTALADSRRHLEAAFG